MSNIAGSQGNIWKKTTTSWRKTIAHRVSTWHRTHSNLTFAGDNQVEREVSPDVSWIAVARPWGWPRHRRDDCGFRNADCGMKTEDTSLMNYCVSSTWQCPTQVITCRNTLDTSLQSAFINPKLSFGLPPFGRVPGFEILQSEIWNPNYEIWPFGTLIAYDLWMRNNKV